MFCEHASADAQIVIWTHQCQFTIHELVFQQLHPFVDSFGSVGLRDIKLRPSTKPDWESPSSNVGIQRHAYQSQHWVFPLQLQRSYDNECSWGSLSLSSSPDFLTKSRFYLRSPTHTI